MLPAESKNSEPISLHERAVDDLRYIREKMADAVAFTSVPGKGGICMGICGVAATPFALHADSIEVWLAIWLAAACAAVAIGGWTMVRKAKAFEQTLASGPGRKFALALLPTLLASGLLTAACYARGATDMLAGIWLLLYGAAVITAGAFSISIVPLMGISFMFLGGVALLGPPNWSDPLMGLGFGGLHILFGSIIAQRYGG